MISGPQSEGHADLDAECAGSGAPMSSEDVREAIRQYALDAGFDVAGFTRAAGDAADAAHLDAYLEEGRHGDMAWMATTQDRRADPTALWSEARTVISVGVNYGPLGDPLAVGERTDRGAVSVYAQGRDYHTVLGKRLKSLGRWLAQTHGCEVKVFVDTAPVMEKPLAQRAGLGWIGKHTNLVSRHFGSWLFLGEVLTTLDLPADQPGTDHCGSCDRCMRACPTDALSEPYRIDPRRCLSYLTIEHKGEIEPDLADAAGNRIYGCDDCLAVCPWNRFASPTPHESLRPRPELAAPRLRDLAELDDPSFRQVFAGTSIKRTGRERFVRNVAIAAVNGGDSETVQRVAADESDVVRTAASRRP